MADEAANYIKETCPKCSGRMYLYKGVKVCEEGDYNDKGIWGWCARCKDHPEIAYGERHVCT
jgi:hypothetical protein